MIKEIHGVADATKIQVGEENNYHVTVRDAEGRVILSIGGMTYPAGLSPEQAEWLAAQLRTAARRVRSSE